MEEIVITDAMAQLSVKQSCIDGASFNNVKLSKATFFDVAMDGVKITNANLSDLEIEGAQLGGAYIHNIGMPPQGHPMYQPGAKMRPVKIENCMLDGSVINDCSLAGVQITNCNITGMTINSILVEDLLKQYQSK
ncbi:MAG TPA: pentapeptide repeat-containing protein [Chitinophagaceae bacterium]|nr:pentapeptide repeat-containing protein [Chitinophagaceae bacterium]